MKRQINYLGFLSLLSLIAILGWTTENHGLYGFLGFAYYIRYFFVIPDEFFRANVQRSATFAFMVEMVGLVPGMFISVALFSVERVVPAAFGLSFALAILAFTGALMVLEAKERKGAAYD